MFPILGFWGLPVGGISILQAGCFEGSDRTSESPARDFERRDRQFSFIAIAVLLY